MSTERNYNHARRVCQDHGNCTFPLCECPLAKPVEIAPVDKDAIRKAMKESRWQHTKRVKSHLP